MNNPQPRKTINPTRWPLLVAFAYLVFGTLWIVLSDRIVAAFVSDEAALTRVQTYKGWGFIVVTAVLLYMSLKLLVVARLRAEAALERSRMQFQRLIESANDGVCVLDPEGRLLYVNRCLCDMLGIDEPDLRQKGVLAYMDEPTAARARTVTDRCRVNGSDEFEGRLLRDDGTDVWAIISSSAFVDEHEIFNGCITVITDITERKKSEQRLQQTFESERRLLNELHHRVRNNLASLNTLIDISRRRAQSVDEFAQTVSGRVSAMAAAHSLLAESKWTPIRLDDLISVLTIGIERNRIRIDGPSVLIAPTQASPLASVIHELVTNARKHGALSADQGTVNIKWHVERDDDAERLSLRWREDAVTTSRQNNASGDGLSMITGLIRSDLRGSIEYELEDGAEFHITIPLEPNHPPAEQQTPSLN